MRQVLVVGAGGHAKSVIDAIQNSANVSVQYVLDNDSTRWGSQVLGVPILGSDQQRDRAIADGCDSFVIAMGTVGQSGLRTTLFELYRQSELHPFSVQHPAAVVSRTASLGDGVQLLACSVTGPGTMIYENVIVNTSAVVEHDCLIGAHSHIAPGALLMGGVQVGMGCHVGAGAVLKENIQVGAGAIIGAGAVVIRDVVAGAVVAGVPARQIRGHVHDN